MGGFLWRGLAGLTVSYLRCICRGIGRSLRSGRIKWRVPALSQSYDPHRASQKLAQLRARYAAQIPGAVAEIRELLGRLAEDWQCDLAAEIRDRLHRLVGSSGTFGFEQVSIESRRLEREVGRWLEAPPDPQAQQQLAALGRRLAHVSPQRTQSPQEPVPARRTHRHPEQGASDLVVFESTPPSQFLAMTQVLGAAGYRLQTRQECDSGADLCPTPAACIVRLLEADPARSILAGSRPSPTVVVSEVDDFASRLQAVRLGSSAFLTEPIDAESLVESLDRLTAHHAEQPFRVLVVDDDVAVAEHNALLLRQEGMQVELVTEPQQAVELLVELQPDLVLMDLYMPDCDGLELAAVIHQQASFFSLPIIFFSVESDPNLQFGDMLRDGDDVLTKPIPPEQLVSAVSHHARRSRLAQSLMTRDGLTGLIGHSLLLERLDQEISRARRRGVQVAFAMVDLDSFKKVNDTYGHAVGDRLLRGFARFIEHTLRRSDSVGRYGGDEFGIVLPGVDAAGAQRILDRARQRFVDQPPVVVGEGAVVSFSCGVADFPSQGSARALTASADQALYLAKRAGRNQVLVAAGT